MDWEVVKIKVVEGISVTLCEDGGWGCRGPYTKVIDKIVRGVIVSPLVSEGIYKFIMCGCGVLWGGG